MQTFGRLRPLSEVVDRLGGLPELGGLWSKPAGVHLGWMVCVRVCVWVHIQRVMLCIQLGGSLGWECLSALLLRLLRDLASLAQQILQAWPRLRPPLPGALGSTWLRTELACLLGGNSHGSYSRCLGP